MAKDFGLILPEIWPSEFEECFACRCSRGSVAWSSIAKLYRTCWRLLQQGVIHFDQIPLNSYLDCFQIQEYSGFCWAKKCHLGNEFLKLHQWAQSWDVNIEGERCWSYYNEWWWLRSWWRPDPRWQFLVVGCRWMSLWSRQSNSTGPIYWGLPWVAMIYAVCMGADRICKSKNYERALIGDCFAVEATICCMRINDCERRNQYDMASYSCSRTVCLQTVFLMVIADSKEESEQQSSKPTQPGQFSFQNMCR